MRRSGQTRVGVMSDFYETRNSVYQVSGTWIRATSGGNSLCGQEWQLAKEITDTGRCLIVVFPSGEGFASSVIKARKPQA